MSEGVPAFQSVHGSHDPLRRSLLLTFVFGYAALSMPRALAASANAAAYTDFLAVSNFLTGKASLDAVLAARLFEALSQDDSAFGEQVQTLRKLIDKVVTDETIYEIDYGVQVTPWFLLRPDLQYIQRPGGTGVIPNAFVLGLTATVVRRFKVIAN